VAIAALIVAIVSAGIAGWSTIYAPLSQVVRAPPPGQCHCHYSSVVALYVRLDALVMLVVHSGRGGVPG